MCAEEAAEALIARHNCGDRPGPQRGGPGAARNGLGAGRGPAAEHRWIPQASQPRPLPPAARVVPPGPAPPP